MAKERWRNVVGYEGFYEISSWGRVKSKTRIVFRGTIKQRVRERFMKLVQRKNGYWLVGLTRNGMTEVPLLHRLLGAAFIPNPGNLPEINHKDGDKGNCHLSNLEWTDHKGNMKHAAEVLGVMRGWDSTGENNPAAKLRWIDVVEIRNRLQDGEKPKMLAKEFGVNCGTIRSIKSGHSWR